MLTMTPVIFSDPYRIAASLGHSNLIANINIMMLLCYFLTKTYNLLAGFKAISYNFASKISIFAKQDGSGRRLAF